MDYRLPQDEFELAVRAWAAESEIVALGERLEQKYNLDPMLLDHLRDALDEKRHDPTDEDAQLRYLLTLTDLLGAALE